MAKQFGRFPCHFDQQRAQRGTLDVIRIKSLLRHTAVMGAKISKTPKCEPMSSLAIEKSRESTDVV